ncbi:MAG: amidohydrolase family protein, partial [Alphaproteobacteria bacterium]|nr:amidohydrolase family protein [Alphaproteobacteria bacterium]
MPDDADLVISGGTVVTMDADRRVLTAGAVAITGNRIAAVGSADDIRTAWRGEQEIDAAGMIVMPGLVSCHGHACNSLVRGMAEDRPLHEWLHEVLWPAMSHAGPDEVYWGSLLSAVELLGGG